MAQPQHPVAPFNTLPRVDGKDGRLIETDTLQHKTLWSVVLTRFSNGIWESFRCSIIYLSKIWFRRKLNYEQKSAPYNRYQSKWLIKRWPPFVSSRRHCRRHRRRHRRRGVAGMAVATTTTKKKDGEKGRPGIHHKAERASGGINENH